MNKFLILSTYFISNLFSLNSAEESYWHNLFSENNNNDIGNVDPSEMSFYGTSQIIPYSKGDFDEATWTALQPYLFPVDHPIKKKLDEIFTKSRASTSIETFAKAGFDYLPLRKWDNVIVAWHSKLKGYLVKVYLDDQIGISDELAFLMRIQGAELIREAIQAFGYQNYFKVPKKWLYPLPNHPSPIPGLQPKKFILVEEDMDLVGSSKNEKIWRQNVTKDLLKALYTLLQTLGLKDSVYITNIPFSRDGKIAFIDTEHFYEWPIKFTRLSHSLNNEMNFYWMSLIHTNGQVPAGNF